MRQILFSIIVPFYNVEKYIRDCLISLKKQSYQNFEVIFVDDGSKDNSYNILESEIGNDTRFKILKQQNTGLPIARNNGMSLAKGEYILYVDSDDFVSPNLLTTLSNVLSERDYDVVQFDHNLVDMEGRFIKSLSISEKLKKIYGIDLVENNLFNIDLVKENCFVDIVPNCWTRCYSRSFLKKNKIDFSDTPFEDSVFTNKVIVKANSIFYINEFLYNYRTRDGSIMNSKSNKVFNVFKNVEILKSFLKQNNLYSSYKKQLDNYELFQVAAAVACLPKSSFPEFKNLCKEKLSFKQYIFIKYLLSPRKSIFRFVSPSYWLYKINKHKWKWFW